MNAFSITMLVATVVTTHFSFIEAAGAPTYLKTWAKNQIYFRVTVPYDERKMIIMRNAIKELKKIVCVKITEVTDSMWLTPDRKRPIQIINAGGCWSFMGDMNSRKHQQLSLDDDCISDWTVKHEFMHLLALDHEHARSDRNEYIDLDKSRIEAGQQNQFSDDATDLYGPFDFQSVMLYSPWEMTNLPGRPIWTVKKGQGKYDAVIDQGSISWLDAKALNQIYKCAQKCKKKCGPDAYLNKDCKCITPDIFAEQQCFDVRNDCKSWIHYCRFDDDLSSECRKTCKICYKSPNGVGSRGPIEICDDSEGWGDRFCKKLSKESQTKIDSECKNEDVTYFCRKTCKVGCLYLEIPKVVDKCQDLDFTCKMHKDYCHESYFQEKCAKTCGYCT